MANAKSFDPEVVAAIGSMFNEKEIKESKKSLAIPSTIIKVDGIYKIEGSISISGRGPRKPTSKIPYKAMIGLLLSRIKGLSRAEATALLTECLRDAIQMGKTARVVVAESFPEITAFESVVDDIMKTLPKVPITPTFTPALTMAVIQSSTKQTDAEGNEIDQASWLAPGPVNSPVDADDEDE